jgi:hypothetical protein
MTRTTRAKAAQLAEELHVDPDALLEQDAKDTLDTGKVVTPNKDERAPLGEIGPNHGGFKEDEGEAAELKKSTRGRKPGKKGAKGKKKNNDGELGASTASQPEGTVTEGFEVAVDHQEADVSPASNSAAGTSTESLHDCGCQL